MLGRQAQRKATLHSIADQVAAPTLSSGGFWCCVSYAGFISNLAQGILKMAVNKSSYIRTGWITGSGNDLKAV
jgi:hypothetical protein